MSMAIKYAMAKKARKMAEGGCPGPDCPGCSSAVCHGGMMAEGGEVKFTEPKVDRGEPEHARNQKGNRQHAMKGVHTPYYYGTESGHSGSSKEKHKENLSYLKSDKTDRKNLAEGGMVDDDDKPDRSGHVSGSYAEGGDMIDRIMRKRSGEPVADFEPADFDVLDEIDVPDDANYTGANSGDELGDGREDDDRRDIVARIMRSRAKKDRMPRPA